MKHLALTAATLCLTACSSPLFGGGATAEGNVDLVLRTIEGLSEGGQPAPEHNAACTQQHGSLIGTKITAEWSINSGTNRQSASVILLDNSIPLYPEGQAANYTFISDGIPEGRQNSGLKLVVFTLTLERRDPKVSLLYRTEGQSFQCTVVTGPFSGS